MADEVRNYWWLNANPAIWSFSDFAPGEENNYTQFNENGSPRQVPKYFPMVRPGDLVLGYVTSPQKELVCLCEITRPLENGEFHYKKLLDFPNPVPASAWTSDPLLKYFHFQGSLFKLSQEQWDGFMRLVKERNPGMSIPQATGENDLEARLDAFLAAFKPTEEILAVRQKAEARRKAFVAKFPLETLATLTPEQYCIGRGDQDNFCWWIERGTMGFSRYFPGTSRSYGMYFKKADSSICKSQLFEKWMKSSKIATDEEALRRLILEPIHQFVVSGGTSEGSQVVGNGFHLKISILYRPGDFIWINSPEWLEKITEALHLPSSGTFVANNLAIKAYYDQKKKQFPGSDFQQSEFISFLVEALNLNEKKVDVISSKTQEMSMRNALNTILYGPPGTGKTHNVVNYVLEIIDGVPVPEEQTVEEYAAAKARFDELKAQGRVAFATFHQSYGYEDFIEGIRPVLDGESGGVGYKLHDGVFKTFCKRAQPAPATEPSGAAKSGEEEDPLEALRHANDVVWKVSLGGSLRVGRPDLEYNKRIHDECFEDGNIRIGWDQYGPLPNEGTDYFMGGQSVLDSFIHKAAVGDIVVSLRTSSEIDGIGVIEGNYEWTGQSAEREEARYDYYNRIRPVRWVVRNARLFIRDINDRKELSQVTFYRTGISKASILALAEKALAGRPAKVQMAEAETDPEVEGDRPYVFIIDEINRGNISKIFGELITLVEVGKRLGAEEETRVVLPYSGEEFGVPPNVYILGTMNTADRSIALLDTALRRRFDFVEMMPRPELLRGVKVIDGKGKDTGLDLEKMLAAMNGRVEFLLDREHTIGHAYFLGAVAEGRTMELGVVADIFQYRIVPLLQEYFFEDYAKIRLVLGDASYKRKVPGVQFVTEEKGLAKELFPGVLEDFGGPVNGDRALYRINGAAFDRAEAYFGIYRPVAGGAAEGPEGGK